MAKSVKLTPIAETDTVRVPTERLAAIRQEIEALERRRDELLQHTDDHRERLAAAIAAGLPDPGDGPPPAVQDIEAKLSILHLAAGKAYDAAHDARKRESRAALAKLRPRRLELLRAQLAGLEAASAAIRDLNALRQETSQLGVEVGLGLWPVSGHPGQVDRWAKDLAEAVADLESGRRA